MRIGQGFDVHPLVAGRKLVLGGVEIPHPKGLQGHSDADVLLHAICDALLGAAGMGDIGGHFPDSDAAFAGVDSRRLLRDVAKKLALAHFRVLNVDATVIAQAPKIASFIPRMIGNIASDLEVTPATVNIKATTTEGLGFAGRKEGIAAMAIALIVSTSEAGAEAG
jgi:2-C-methyl-D-erythritol 2,4-cyclodiphosphate synthase